MEDYNHFILDIMAFVDLMMHGGRPVELPPTVIIYPCLKSSYILPQQNICPVYKSVA